MSKVIDEKKDEYAKLNLPNIDPYHIKKEYKGQTLNSSGSTRDRDSNTEKKGSLEDETTELIPQSFIICYIIYINKYVN